MTQLDVPTISFSHYLDLLKRRTWHVVLVSIFGLVIGGFVALLIPRYYVAHTEMQFQGSLLRELGSRQEDPLGQVIKEARDTIPQGVERAIQDLGWPEASLQGLERRDFIATLRTRVRAYDLNSGKDPRRQSNELRIVYADTDGERAAEMANKLRDLWIEDYVQGLRRRAEQEVEVQQEKHRGILKEKAEVAENLRGFETENGLDPREWRAMETLTGRSDLSQEIRSAAERVLSSEAEIIRLEASLEAARGRLSSLPPTVPMTLEDRIPDPALLKQHQLLTQQIQILAFKLQTFKPGHPDYQGTLKQRERLEGTLALLERQAGGAAAEDKPNPEYEDQQAEIRKLNAELRAHRQIKARDEAQILALRARAKLLPGIFEEYRKLRDRLNLLDSREQEVYRKVGEAEALALRANTDEPLKRSFDAYPPPTPTEPNPILLALIGCAVGLGLAIALVLLIDLLQLTFKSVADVEGGLGLPVLGSMSYLQTENERRDLRSRRLWMTVFSALFLGMLVTVVTLYYVQPTALPTLVVDILEVLLGGSS